MIFKETVFQCELDKNKNNGRSPLGLRQHKFPLIPHVHNNYEMLDIENVK